MQTAPVKKPADHPVLFQTYFKSKGPRTYAAQVKRAGNDNHYLVLTEGKREKDSDEVRKTRLFIYSEDFPDFFKMIKAAAEWVKANPLPADYRQKRERFWAKPANVGGGSAKPAAKAAPPNGKAVPAMGKATPPMVKAAGAGKLAPAAR